MTQRKTIQSLVRKNIMRLAPYSSARDEFSGEAVVWMDANENPYPGEMQFVMRDPVTGRDLAVFNEKALNRYPDPYQKILKERIAKGKGVSAEQVFLGNGSDEILDLLFRTFCEPGRDEVVLMPPTYGMYAVLADIHGIGIREVPLDESLQPVTESVLKQVDENTRMLFLCSPNNPTGNVMDREKIVTLLENFQGLVIVDEAYIDFAPEKSILPLIRDYDKLVVLQTFSKARGLAGIRLGMAFAAPEVFHWLNRVKLPYNVNRLTLAMASLRFEDKTQTATVEKILAERERLADYLADSPEVKKIYPSDANFLLACVKDPEGIYRYLLEQGIVVRLRPGIPGCGKAVRITVGTQEENELLLKALEDYDREKKKL